MQFFEDLMLVGKVLEEVYSADKMNFEILGNSVPHLHCHIIPRYYGDPAPNRPITLPFVEVVRLKPEQYMDQVKRIRKALSKVKRGHIS
jgi:diadenosine tetraphosphate (Ap4A) HIT family hydrolase